jgi:hypothetical protein
MPRYRVTPKLMWAALIPAGTLLFCAYLMAIGYEPLAFMDAQTRFTRHEFVLPFVTVWKGALLAWEQLRIGIMARDGLATSTQGVVGMLALVVAVTTLRGVWRRLPFAYAAFIVVGLLVPLCTPTVGDPLKGLGRYVTVLFPLYMAAAAWAVEHRARRLLLIGCGALLILFTAQFATWHIVGAQLL